MYTIDHCLKEYKQALKEGDLLLASQWLRRYQVAVNKKVQEEKK